MVEVQYDHDAAGETSGKALHHVARYSEPRPGPGPDRTVFDVVTDDFAVYRFSQLTPSDPYSFEPGQKHDNRVSRSGRLPGVVEAILDAELTDSDGDPDPGWIY